jgi:hypothetical protein
MNKITYLGLLKYEKQSLLVMLVTLIFAIIFGWYLFVKNPRNTTADIYLEKCLESSFGMKDMTWSETLTYCEMEVNIYRKYGEWKF